MIIIKPEMIIVTLALTAVLRSVDQLHVEQLTQQGQKIVGVSALPPAREGGGSCVPPVSNGVGAVLGRLGHSMTGGGGGGLGQ